MAKTRVSVLAKELGLELKDFTAHLDKLGIRGKKSQSTLEDDEVARVKAALAAPARPQVVVGEEKVVADRVVTTEEAQAHETVVERRVRANVIRRRTNRTEVVSAQPAAEAKSEAVETRPSPEDIPGETEQAFQADEIETIPEIEQPIEEIPAAILEAEAAEKAPEPLAPEPAPEKVEEKPAPAGPAAAAPQPPAQEAPRGARVLGRIDLKQVSRPVAPSAPLR
ncbi:MAG TPA: translation initiation factor IF-2 N-terminal domain-containing protein, partial [Candidatus Binatia bacterium]